MKDSTFDGDTVSVSDIVQYTYCPRKIYFLKVLGAPIKARRKMTHGKEAQERERGRLMERKTVYGFERSRVKEVIHNLHVESPGIGLSGQVDTVLRLEDDQIVPVDTKYTDEVRVYRTFRKQLVAYAMLLDHEYKSNTTIGVIYFARQKRPVRIGIQREDKEHLLRDIERIRGILSGEEMPGKTATKKCGYCEAKRYCI